MSASLLGDRSHIRSQADRPNIFDYFKFNGNESCDLTIRPIFHHDHDKNTFANLMRFIIVTILRPIGFAPND